ncbi:DUF308 domain-containing protein [Dysosmobacter sp.]|uniref:DUF308 domain-containing protein n=1 Tax=Dysosmobacter sp. TaxID=2591382 RepID=UPI002A87B337|nr:DUF308 domain-containing protein [Dysosmobacter sp.]MDY3282439.1 DUF308 domain-containing protein [Dysosmobacter sp.]
MPDKEVVQEIIRSAPAVRAYGPHHHHRTANTAAGRIFAAAQMVLGVCCVLLAQQVYRALPFLLGGGMVLAGVNRMVCGFWTREYRWKETKLTANGIVYLLLGLVILFHHAGADTLIGSIWGVLGLMKGSEALNGALYRLSHKEPCAALGIQAAVELALGFLLLIDPWSAVRHHVPLLGLELAVMGWQSLRESK